MNVLFISPHPDDLILQNSFALWKHHKRGDNIHIIIVSECEHLERNAGIIEETDCVLERVSYETVTRLGLPTRELWMVGNREILRETMEAYRDTEGVRVVYAPWCGDIHQDHKAVFEEAVRVFRYATVLQGYHPHSCPGFAADYYIEGDYNMLAWKLGLLGLFRTQSGLNYATWDYNEAITLSAGCEINRGYAERYKVWRVLA